MAEASAPVKDTSADDVSSNSPSFLSALKAFYEAIELYLKVVGLLAGVPATFALVALKWGMSTWIAVIICAVPAGLILLWLVPTWRERKNKQQAIALGIHGNIKDPSYFRLTPYDETAEFNRVDHIHESVYAWIVSASAPLLYLIGASGSGKSSIISAWVVPKLNREGGAARVVSVRVVASPISAITQALLEPNVIWERPPADKNLSLRELLEKAAKRVAPKKLLLFLDQFEEFLILAGEEQQDSFTTSLRSLAETPIPNLRVVIILRSDYEPLLEGLRLPALEQNRKVVPPFFERDAMAFLRGSELQISDTLEREILREARDVEQTPGLIRPITVNLFGLVLRRFETLPKNYGNGTLLRSYLKELIQRKEIREFAAPILCSMMTGNGTKLPVAYTEIARAVNLDPRQVRGCLVQLANEGIVRELDRQQGIWEIAHDFIASLYHQILASWRVSAWGRARPWAIGGGIVIWLVTLFFLPIATSAWEENREQDALISLGFSRESCANSDKSGSGLICLKLNESFGDAELAAAAPHLKKLRKTYILDLSETKITSIDALRGVVGIRSLYLVHTEVKAIGALEEVSGLESLDLRGTNVENIDVVKQMSGLRELYLLNSRVENIDALKGLSGLRVLELGKVENLNALEGLNGLQSLYVEGNVGNYLINNNGFDIDALQKLTSLRELYLGFDNIHSIKSLAGLKNLEKLDLSNNNVENLDALSVMSGLRELDLGGNPLRSIDALKGLVHLRKLFLDGSRLLNSIAPLADLSGLEVLDISYCPVRDIDSLNAMKGLQKLYLRQTAVEKIDALRGMNKLRVLDLRDTRVLDVDVLKGLSSLETLVLDWRLTGYDALQAALPHVKIENNGISDRIRPYSPRL